MSNLRFKFIFLLLIYFSLLFAQNESGLLFQSKLVNKDMRTSLHLTPNEDAFEFSNSFTIEFDLKLQDPPVKFGYIFRIIFENNLNFDLLLNVPTRSTAHLLLIAEKEDLCEVPIRNSNFRLTDWNRVKLTFNSSKGVCTFELNDEVFNSTYKFPLKKSVDVCFGVNNKAPFITNDAPPIIIKNIYVNIDNKRKEYLWKLNKHRQNEVYDKINNKLATVTNPVWLIDRHIVWGNNKQLKFPTKVFAVFDGDNFLYIISADKVYRYNLTSYELTDYPFRPEIPINQLSNQFVYDSVKHQIIYSDFDLDTIQPIVSRFSFESKSWDIPIKHNIESKYQQHNNFYSPIDSSLFQIFGYGFYTYKSDIKQILKDGRLVSKTFAPIISPRYLSATGIHDSTLYIYGGIGNQTGKQEYGSQLFNDLYEVNLRTLKVTKRWDRDPNIKNEVAARTLIIDKTGKKAFSLFFNPTRYSSYLLLNEIDLVKSDTRVFGDTIPYFFQDTQSEAMLLFSETAKKYYAITIHKSDNTDYILNTYEISHPILSANDVIQSAQKKQLWRWYLVVILLIAGISGFILNRKKYKRLDNKPNNLIISNSNQITEQFNILAGELKRPGIYLLGGFQIIDIDNQDKTGEFTPIMKLMLSLIILYTLKNGKGISNVKLKEILWYDKSEESARNNRSVNISKIRFALSSITSIEITNDNSYWFIDFKDGAYCDYNQSLTQLKELQKNTEICPEYIINLLNIISAGELLPDIQEDWIDNFKSEYSNLVIDVLLSINNHKNLTNNPKLLIKIADTILILDTLNEDAIKLKCKSLIKLGRIKIAMDVFNSFCKEYKLVLNENFDCNFESFMKQ